MLLRILLLPMLLAGCLAQPDPDWATATTVPGEITLEILPTSGFTAIYGPDIVAMSWFAENPCRIVLRAGMMIRYTADPTVLHPQANFVDPDNADTIAHEILHCTPGYARWHSS